MCKFQTVIIERIYISFYANFKFSVLEWVFYVYAIFQPYTVWTHSFEVLQQFVYSTYNNWLVLVQWNIKLFPVCKMAKCKVHRKPSADKWKNLSKKIAFFAFLYFWSFFTNFGKISYDKLCISKFMLAYFRWLLHSLFLNFDFSNMNTEYWHGTDNRFFFSYFLQIFIYWSDRWAL